MTNSPHKERTTRRYDSQILAHATIMMVDDEPITMEMVRIYLNDFGYRNFVLVEDSATALHVLEKTNPDLLLLDLFMPQVSGFDILTTIRALPKFKHLPIIILTGSTDPGDKLQALDLGATDFLGKPVDPSELGLRIRNTLAAKAYMDRLAFYDPQTSLPNRQMFLERFDWTLQKAKRYQEQLALLNISLDNLDKVNATIGHRGADEVLNQIARRIEGVVRNSDILTLDHGNDVSEMMLFRTEGSTFSLLLDRIHDVKGAATVAERILRTVREPMQVEGSEIFLRANIGIATFPAESDDRDTLLRLASSAKDYGKNKGGDCFHFSSAAINSLYEKRRSIESRLRNALHNDEFTLCYQPQLDILTNTIKGVEVLLRWKDRDGTFVPPEEFVPVAEETGLIIPIGEWILKKAFSQLSEWHNSGSTRITMSVNLSTRQFVDYDFFTLVRDSVEHSNVDPRYLILEITETLLMADIKHTRGLLQEFKDMGIRLSVDDFGTGYSSLSYLCELPVDELKIDRSFIAGIPDNPGKCSVVSTILMLAHSLRLQTVAEGVETRKQLSFLQDNMCHMYQGYLHSKPLDGAELRALLLPEDE